MDFFMVSFVVAHIAQEFHASIPTVAFAITASLMMRPLGALIFGLLGDRFGRRVPLMIDIVFYSVVELLSGFAPNFTIFLILRFIYGVAMGGEWGLGMSLALETLPSHSRGLFSGILQQGYALGYLLAAVVFALVFPAFGWRAMFFVGVVPALLVLFLRYGVKESPAWERRAQQHQQGFGAMWQAVKHHWPVFIFMVVLMTGFNFMSHGTQDLYPTFLEVQRGYSTSETARTAIIYNVGAIIGGTLFGFFSQRIGRRRAIVLACILGAVMIPLWVFSPSVVLLTLGAFLMQFMVQGAWGIVPAHLNELSPAVVRGTLPGLAYQLGNLFSAGAAQMEAAFAASYFGTPGGGANYAQALAVLAIIVFVVVGLLAGFGPEARGVDLSEGAHALQQQSFSNTPPLS
ncbi:MAG: MFS transporter [Firmicutes bacterium]|nr:MFS transporter [Bacillota bacterium]